MRRLALALSAVAVVALAACAPSPVLDPSGGGEAPAHGGGLTPPAVPPVEVAPTGAARPVEFTVDLTSAGTTLNKVGPAEEITYGWNDLRGSTAVDGEPAQVSLQGSVWYVGGAGTWWGFFTVTFADGSVLGLNVDEGVARKASDSVTEFQGTTVVIGGTGRFANATGSGSVIGSRDSAIGGEVTMKVSTEVTS